MESHEAAAAADQRVRWDASPCGNLALHFGLSEKYRVRVAPPVGPAARRTVKTRTSAFKCFGYSLEIVWPAVAFHRSSVA